MSYVDGFVIPVAKNKVAAYKRMAEQGKKTWMKHGAVQYFECVADDMNIPMGIPFPKLVKPKAGEIVVFSWILYKSKADRNKINAKVMKDPRIAGTCDPKKMPFDCKRMSMGGFKTIVDL